MRDLMADALIQKEYSFAKYQSLVSLRESMTWEIGNTTIEEDIEVY